jgi:hypothetical protein
VQRNYSLRSETLGELQPVFDLIESIANERIIFTSVIIDGNTTLLITAYNATDGDVEKALEAAGGKTTLFSSIATMLKEARSDVKRMTDVVNGTVWNALEVYSDVNRMLLDSTVTVIQVSVGILSSSECLRFDLMG